MMEENRIHRRVLYMNLESTRTRGRPRTGWQDEVKEVKVKVKQPHYRPGKAHRVLGG
jgi:hypothetical protein